MNELRLVIPLIPPSNNVYKTYRVITPKGGGRPFVSWYLTEEAESWCAMVAAIAGGRQIISKQLEVSFIIFVPPVSRLDVDNASKVILDSLTKTKVIIDDRYILDLHCHKRVDAINPRTVIAIRGAQDQLFERL